MTKLDDTIRDLKENKLTGIYLGNHSYCDIDAKGVKLLSEALKVNNTVATIDFWPNNIGAEGVKHLVEALKVNKTVTKIGLQHNNIGDEGVKHLVEALKVNSTITDINLSDNNIGIEGVKHLVEALKVNKAVTKIGFHSNNIGTDGAWLLAEALKVNNTVTDINFSHNNNIGTEEAKILAEILKVNTVITSIYSYNINTEGAKLLAEVLRTNNSVRYIDLRENNIGADGAKAIAGALKVNNSVRHIDLRNNNIGNDGAKAIAGALKVNNSVHYINLMYNKVDVKLEQEINKEIEGYITRNHEYAVTYYFKNLNEDFKNLQLKATKYLNSLDDKKSPDLKEKITDKSLDVNKGLFDESAELENFFSTLKSNREQLLLKFLTSYDSYDDSTLKDLIKSCNNEKAILQYGFTSLHITAMVGNSKLAAALIARDKNLTKQKDILKRNFADVAVAYGYAEFEEDTYNLIQNYEVEMLKNAKTIEPYEEKEAEPEFGLFEVSNTSPKTNLDLNLTIMQNISDLVKEGNLRMNDTAQKGILLLGKTGSGKSTLAHVLSGKELNAVKIAKTKKMVIEALDSIDGINISHKKISETRIPAKCKASKEDGDIVIWDCPGFSDTEGIEQEIANSFYIKKLFSNNKQLKFILVIPESSLTSQRGIDFIDTVDQFIKMFNDVKAVQGSVSLVVTHCSDDMEVENVRSIIEEIILDRNITKKYSLAVDSITKNSLINSVQIFHKPLKEGSVVIPDGFLNELENSTTYIETSPDMAKLSISEQSMDYIRNLLTSADESFRQIVNILASGVYDIRNLIKEVTNGNSSSFAKHYKMIESLLPKSMEYADFNRLMKHGVKGEDFMNLDAITKTSNILKSANNINSVGKAVSVFQELLSVFEEYSMGKGAEELKTMIQEYSYCLKQQMEYVRIFSQMSESQMPNYLEKLTKIIKSCSETVDRSFKAEIQAMSIDPVHDEPAYYKEALNYLKLYKDEICTKKQAFSYKCLGDLYNHNQDTKTAMKCYVKALELDKTLSDAYLKAGDILFANGKYEEAINLYGGINHSFKIKACFKELLKLHPEDPELMMKAGDYFASIGIYPKAIEMYEDACSLSKDEQFKEKAWHKVANALRGADSLANSFDQKADNHDFFSFDAINTDELRKLLGEDEGV